MICSLYLNPHNTYSSLSRSTMQSWEITAGNFAQLADLLREEELQMAESECVRVWSFSVKRLRLMYKAHYTVDKQKRKTDERRFENPESSAAPQLFSTTDSSDIQLTSILPKKNTMTIQSHCWQTCTPYPTAPLTLPVITQKSALSKLVFWPHHSASINTWFLPREMDPLYFMCLTMQYLW